MISFFKNIFQGDFMPHGHCYFWEPEILWLHVISDVVIFLAYYSIPLALVCFLVKRKDIPFRLIFLLFAIFILACGTTHIMDVWTTWSAAYRIEGLVKAFTALVSLTTAIILWPLLPKAMAIPTPAHFEKINLKLQKIAEEANKKAFELDSANRELERFNLAMMGREERILELKAEVNDLCRKFNQPEPYKIES
ncbi:MAG TPA: hypothetical protein DDW49_02225 [Deltaproteobacteria bacterium]|nr:MAG: hypothetical protein A2048_06810 [Deltaproteobacteria bacterium GWA2_45_12]HBF12201.1 hypothetical protein [Deltaproteobacteria bacterium]